MKAPRNELSSLAVLVGLLLSSMSMMTTAQSLTNCYISMVIADRQGAENDLLSRDEYVTFVSRISTSFDASGSPFDGLPAPLQQNFVKYAGDDQINIFGAKPGQNEVTEEQEVFLTELCDGTITTINALANPTMAPVGSTSSTPRPTRPLNQCFVGMLVNDVNPKNDLLDASEYVGFLNFLEPGPFSGLTYSELPLTLQSNYANLVNNNDDGIDVYGLPSPGDDLFRKLETVCDITNTAISIALNIPTDPPLPSTEPTTLPTVAAPETRAPISIAPITSAPVGGDTEEPTVFPTQSPTIRTPSTSRAPITFAPGAPTTLAPNALAPVTATPGSSRPSKEPTTLPTLSPTTVPTSSPTMEAMNNGTSAAVTMAPVTRAPVTRAPVTSSPNTLPQATKPPTFAPTTQAPSPTSGSTVRNRSRMSAAAMIVVSLVCIAFEFIL